MIQNDLTNMYMSETLYIITLFYDDNMDKITDYEFRAIIILL